MAGAERKCIWRPTELGGVVEIGKHIGMKRQNVGPQLRILKEQGLLELVDAPGGRDIWAKKAIDRTLRISKYLCDEYNLRPDGRPNRAAKKKHK